MTATAAPSKKVTKDKNVEADCRKFGERLLSAMENCNVSQADLSRFMGVSRSAVNWWVQGNTYPSIDNARRLADYLRTTPEYLLFGVLHVAEERLVESIPVIDRSDGQHHEITRMTLPREFMARAHLPDSKVLRAVSMFDGGLNTIAIADTSDRTINSRQSKIMVLDYDGRMEVGKAIKKKGDAGTICFETGGRKIELPYQEKMVVGRLTATVSA